MRPKYQDDVLFRFIPPCSTVLAKTVPIGEDWQHEIKFDGVRVQIYSGRLALSWRLGWQGWMNWKNTLLPPPSMAERHSLKSRSFQRLNVAAFFGRD